MILLKYVSKVYAVKNFNLESFSEHDPLFSQVKADEEYLNLFCFIIAKRMIVIDDTEFQEKKKFPSKYPFIPFSDIRYVSWVLNNLAYRIFQSEYTMQQFSDDFLQNLKKALVSLYDRDMRLKINGENFWIIEKDIFERMEPLTHMQLVKAISPTHLVNIPHTIPF